MHLKTNNIKSYLSSINKDALLKEQHHNTQLRFILTQICNESCFFCHNE